MGSTDDTSNERVGFRDIYRAVTESETRIKEHISLVLLPLATQIADHELRLSKVEGRVTAIELTETNALAAGAERKRIGDISGKALAGIIVVTNFVLGAFVTLLTLVHPH
jgi:hypothetical protein